MAINESKLDELEVETTLAFARHMLENARNLWIKASSPQKEVLQASGSQKNYRT